MGCKSYLCEGKRPREAVAGRDKKEEASVVVSQLAVSIEQSSLTMGVAATAESGCVMSDVGKAAT